MTNDERKALIEKAAKAIWIERNAGDDVGWGEAAWAELTAPDDWSREALDALEEARAALAVFEQVHTTTDDELEAAAERYRQDAGWTMAEGDAVVDAFLAGATAGFRRRAQAEPTDWSRYIENPVTGEVSLAPEFVIPTDDEREALSNFLFTVYEHGSQPNALREADAILGFLQARRTAVQEPSASQYGEWESRGETVDAAVFNVASRHHIHGVQCLCGFESHRARSRTEHIIDATLAALAAAGAVGQEGEQ